MAEGHRGSDAASLKFTESTIMKSTRALVALGIAPLLGLSALAMLDGPLTTHLARADSVLEKKPFLVFDSTLYAGKPDLSQYGISSCEMRS